MYKVHQDAEFIPVDYSSEEIANSDMGPVPSISVTASRKDGVINVAVTNTDLKAGQKFLLTWDSMPAKFSKDNVSASILSAKNIADFNDFDKPALVSPESFTGYKVTKEGIEVNMPAMSIITFAIK